MKIIISVAITVLSLPLMAQQPKAADQRCVDQPSICEMKVPSPLQREGNTFANSNSVSIPIPVCISSNDYCEALTPPELKIRS